MARVGWGSAVWLCASSSGCLHLSPARWPSQVAATADTESLSVYVKVRSRSTAPHGPMHVRPIHTSWAMDHGENVISTARFNP